MLNNTIVGRINTLLDNARKDKVTKRYENLKLEDKSSQYWSGYYEGRIDALCDASCNTWNLGKIVAEFIEELNIAELKAIAEMMSSRRYKLEEEFKASLLGK
jgi:hypothetical protein